MDDFPKTDKITRVLTLYQQLSSGQDVNKAYFSLMHGISERSFDRDIEDIRLFLSESYSGNNLLYNKETGAYRLSGNQPSFMDRMDAAAIAKILLSSRSLRKDETMGLYDTLLSMVTPRDAGVIREYLQQDIQQYESFTRDALLKVIGDLFVAIRSGVDLELTIHSQNNDNETLQCSPLELRIEDNHFLLVAAKERTLSHIVYLPLEAIDNFQKLPSSFAQTLQKQYFQQKSNERISNNDKER